MLSAFTTKKYLLNKDLECSTDVLKENDDNIIYVFMDPLDRTRNPALERYALFLAKAKYKSEKFEEKNEITKSNAGKFQK